MKDLAFKIAIYNGQTGTPKQVERVLKNFKNSLELMENFARPRGLI